jgi:DNA invertase Pin-like site-specific DNA recombinase
MEVLAMIVHSYSRFSTPGQATGDSLRRQQQQAAEFCKRRGWELSNLRFEDLGRSAFKANKQRALDAFLKAIDDGRVKRGECLLVEAVDRLSRKGIPQTQNLVNHILGAGVSIAILSPIEKVYQPGSNADIGSAIELVSFAYQAHIYSENLSYRLKEHGKRQRKLRASGEDVLLSSHLPGWLRRNKRGQLEVDQEAAKTVKHIFKRCLQGAGQTTICAELNRDWPALGTSGKWNKTLIQQILRGRAVLGEVVSSVTGEVFPNYYPAILDEKTWQRAQLKISQRTKVRGRATQKINILAGLLHHAGDGSACRVYSTQRATGESWRRYVSAKSAERMPGADVTGAEIQRVEDMLFRCLPAVQLGNPQADETVGLRQQRQSLLEDIATTQKQITSRAKSAAVLIPVLTSLQEQLDEVEAKLAQMKHSAAPTKAYREQLASMRRGTSEERLAVAEGIRRLLSRVWMLPFKLAAKRNGLILEMVFHDGRRSRWVEMPQQHYWGEESFRDLREQVVEGWRPNVELYKLAAADWLGDDDTEALVAFRASFLDG